MPLLLRALALLLAGLILAFAVAGCDGDAADEVDPMPSSTAVPEPTAQPEPTTVPDPTAAPEATAVLESIAVPTPTAEAPTAPTPQPLPSPTPIPTLTPTPTPEPAIYVIETLEAAFTGVNGGLVSTEFSIAVRNVGGSGGPDSAPVMMAVNEDLPEKAYDIDRPSSGDAASYIVARDLELGQHMVSFEIGGAVREIHVDVKAVDIVLEPLQHEIKNEGSLDILVRVTNLGDLSAAGVSVVANWEVSQLDSNGSAIPQRTSAVIGPLDVDETKVIELPIDVPTGEYTVTLSAQTEAIEVRQDNNIAETLVEVDYVQLVPSIESTEIIGYEPDGNGVVEVTLAVENRGVAPSGPISVGLACLHENIEGCSQGIAVDSIRPGTSTSVPAALSLPQGETEVFVFGGANENGYLWGDRNVQLATISVPHKPPVNLVLSAGSDVREYWSDGSANVELTVSLHNDGYLRVDDPQHVTVVCLQGGETVSDCGAEASIQMSDGYGPATSTAMVRAPMGSTLQVNLGSEGHQALRFDVPERILGVDRDVWACYSDRPGEGATREGCGGWFRKTVAKWDHDVSVRVWAHGKPEYIQVLEQVMEEVAPLVNLRFERVDSKEEADIEIQLGVDRSEAPEIAWQSCVDHGGCADSRVHDSGNVKFGFIVVWEAGEAGEWVKGVILHELLHVVVPIAHRHTYDTLMGKGARLSLFDEELIRLHSHQLIKPGMTMDEVEGLIVFNDELVNPLPETEYKKVWSVVSRAENVLSRAESARFELTGTGSKCRFKLGPAVYEVGDFRGRSTELVHYRDRFDRFLNWDGAIWKETNGAWEQVDQSVFYEATRLNYDWSSPLVALRAVLAVSGDDEVRVVSRENGHVTVETRVNREGYTRVVVIIVDEETYEISRYIMSTQPWVLSSIECTIVLTADKIEYGVEITIPESLFDSQQR